MEPNERGVRVVVGDHACDFNPFHEFEVVGVDRPEAVRAVVRPLVRRGVPQRTEGLEAGDRRRGCS